MSIFLCMQAQPVLKSSVDSNTILIGGQFTLTVQTSLPQEDFFIKWVQIPDSLSHFELIKKSKIDSSFTHQKLTGLSQQFTFTSFDSGSFILPAFPVFFNPLNDDTTFNLFTDSVTVSVSYQPGSNLSFRDIKPIIDVLIPLPIWQWITGIVIFIIAITVLFFWWRHNKIKNKSFVNRNAKTAFETAMFELEQLQKLDAAAAITVKEFYSQLPKILKQYLTDLKGIDCFTKTTAELLIYLKDLNTEPELLSKTAAALRLSDAVKYARFIPESSENNNCIHWIQQAIKFINSQTKINYNNN